MPKTERKKFKDEKLETYIKGKWFKQWSGIKNDREVQRRLKFTISARDKKDFSIVSGSRLELIQGTKNHYSIRTGSGQWRIFFVWEKNEAWEIDLSKHDYKENKKIT